MTKSPKKQRQKFNKKLLNDLVQEYEVKLIGEYKEGEINRDTRIKGYCISKDCKEEFEKSLRNLVEGGGCYCKKCAVINRKQKTENTNLVRYGNTNSSLVKSIREKTKKTKISQGIKIYDRQLLDTIISECKVKLIGEYTIVNTKTIIKGYCISEDCNEIFEKSFLMIVKGDGCYCKKCVMVHQGKKLFDTEKVKNLIHQFNIILLKPYNGNNRETVISGLCISENCEGIFSKQILNIKDKNSFYCMKCQYMNNGKKLYDINLLKNITSDVQLIGEYPKVNRETIIKGYCITENCDNIFEKTFRMLIEKSGCYCQKCTSINKEIKTKITNIDRFGGHPMFLEEMKEKMRTTNIDRRGVSHPMHDPKIFNKVMDKLYTIKNYTLPSGDRIQYQGYENKALDELVELYDEDDIIIGGENVPECWYQNDNKNHRYFIDIFILSQNLGIEVKSDYTFSVDNDTIMKKKEAFENLGYTCEIWIYDKKGNKTIVK